MKEWNEDWNFKTNLDHIFDTIRKASRVIKSSQTIDQLKVAERYINNLETYLNCFDRSDRQINFCEMQIKEFKKILNIRFKAILE